MNRALTEHLEQLLGHSIKEVRPVSGGDIASAFLLITETDRFFCKLLDRPDGLAMLEAESGGLNAIRACSVIKTPEVIHCANTNSGAILIMEFVESKRPNDSDLALFGRQLAQLHLQEAPYFGWKSDNYIGSLPQSNRKTEHWPEFYVGERLEPQFRAAVDSRLLSYSEVPSATTMLPVLRGLCPETNPSLLHGDLWGGNYLIAKDGCPYLIDPAVYFGHSEVDIAMSRLFGGFGHAFYKSYEDVIPSDADSMDRIKIYQLYYLLVHLNLFGSSYYSSVNAIVKQFFR